MMIVHCVYIRIAGHAHGADVASYYLLADNAIQYALRSLVVRCI